MGSTGRSIVNRFEVTNLYPKKSSQICLMFPNQHLKQNFDDQTKTEPSTMGQIYNQHYTLAANFQWTTTIKTALIECMLLYAGICYMYE